MQVIIKKGSTGGSTAISISEDATVQELFDKVAKEISPPGDYSLICGRYNLHGFRSKKLATYDVKNKSTVYLVYRVNGGGNEAEKMRNLVTWTNDECMITLEGKRNARMICGHVISPQGMTDYARDAVKSGQCNFNCPSCKRDWPFFLVEYVGNFTETERSEIQSKIAESFMERSMGVQKCPSCMNYCQRKNSSDVCVVCPVCTVKNGSNYEFCWYCLQKWCGPNYRTCGNSACTKQDSRNQYLRKEVCGEIEMGYTKIKCPAVRACPSCGVLINHAEGCKQMKCLQCKQDFCFVCLKQPQDGKWKCGSYNTKCDVAPIQTF